MSRTRSKKKQRLIDLLLLGYRGLLRPRSDWNELKDALMKTTQEDEVLILTKTYPAPSSAYREITCVAGVNSNGELRRIFPVPFRLLSDDKRFSKWQWIRARFRRTDKDKRPESRRIDTDSIVLGSRITSDQRWAKRIKWIAPHVCDSPEILEQKRQAEGKTLGLVRPKRLIKLEIVSASEKEWTEKDKRKLIQDDLFDREEIRNRPPLKKVPYDFYYHYECNASSVAKAFRHKLTDWEVGALYRSCVYKYGKLWESPFRN